MPNSNTAAENPENMVSEEQSGSKPVICLLVDDVALNLKVLAAMVKKANGIPVLVNSAKEALDLLVGNKVHLILTDLWMPEMNGEEFAKTVRENPLYRNIPLIAVTADIEYKSNFDMQYFDDVLIKPVSFEMLQNNLFRYKL